MITLTPMTREEYEAWREESIRGFAQERVRAGNTPPEEALSFARRAFESLLPRGLDTPDQWLYSVRDGDTPVGVVWLGRGQPGAGLPPTTGFIYDLLIFSEHRRKGYGAQAMLALEQEARRRGMDSLALHVFGHNVAARALYDSLGYEATSITMRKRLD